MPRKTQAPDQGLNLLKTSLKDRSLGHYYIFHGEEAYLREYYLGQLIKTVLDSEDGLFVFDGGEISAEKFSDAVESFSFFGGNKLLIIRDYDLSKADARMSAAISGFVKNPAEFAYAVFVYSTLEYKPPKGELAGLCKNEVQFDRPGEAELVSWIGRRFAALNCSCPPDAAKHLISRCGGLMYKLIPEIEKIAAFSGGGAITIPKINAVSSEDTDAQGYQMAEAVLRRDPAEALTLADKLFDMRLDPVLILSALSKALRQMYGARLATGPMSLAELTGVNYPSISSKIAQRAAKIPLNRLREMNLLALRCDVDLKSKPGDRRIMLETLISRLCALL